MRFNGLRWLGLGAAIGILGIVLSSCGKVCTFGQGDCEQALNASTLTLTSSATSMVVSTGSVTFTASGGSGTYSSYTVLAGSCTLGSSSGSSTTVTASSTAGTCCIRVTDSASATADRCVTVS